MVQTFSRVENVPVGWLPLCNEFANVQIPLKRINSWERKTILILREEIIVLVEQGERIDC